MNPRRLHRSLAVTRAITGREICARCGRTLADHVTGEHIFLGQQDQPGLREGDSAPVITPERIDGEPQRFERHTPIVLSPAELLQGCDECGREIW